MSDIFNGFCLYCHLLFCNIKLYIDSYVEFIVGLLFVFAQQGLLWIILLLIVVFVAAF